MAVAIADRLARVQGATATIIVGVSSTVVGVVALYAAARNNRLTLENQRRMASDERLWDMRLKVEQEISDWLATHQYVGTGKVLYEVNPSWTLTFDPGITLLSRARQFAPKAVVEPLRKLHEHGAREAEMADALRLITDDEVPGGFKDGHIAPVFGWSSSGDAIAELDAERRQWREAWSKAETELHNAHRDSTAPDS